MTLTLKIAARKSDLARLQAYTVGDALETNNPGLKVSYEFRESLGDKNLNDPLWKMPEKGVFTEDFLDDLKSGQCDLVVHSWKDLPLGDRAGTKIAFTPLRADSRDILLFKKSRLKSLTQTPTLTKILSSSPRRAHNLPPFLAVALPGGNHPHPEFLPVRGNVPTRIRKLIESKEADGLVLAKAALDRLLTAPRAEFDEVKAQLRAWLSELDVMILPLSVNPTAAAQGALAIEIRDRDFARLAPLFRGIHDQGTFNAVEMERGILSLYGGGCHQKIGVSVLNRVFGQVVSVKGKTLDGIDLDRWELKPIPGTTSTWTSPSQIDDVWPRDLSQTRLFDRESFDSKLNAKDPQWTESLWVAKADALPSFMTPEKQPALLWTAGLSTWKKLAQKGFWVHGSSDSLGEAEDQSLAVLFTKLASHPFSKITHEQAALFVHPEATDPMPSIATYRLDRNKTPLDLSGKTHFFWRSGSLFREALEEYPEIVEGFHWCGPGNTYLQVEALLAEKSRFGSSRLFVCLDFNSWTRLMEGKSDE